MEKKLYTQIKNEWRSNVWLLVELLLVSVVLWYVVNGLMNTYLVYSQPRGFNTDHCYKIVMEALTDKSPDCRPYRTNDKRRDDVYELAERLRRRPEIEAVSLSYNSHPYNGSNATQVVAYDTLSSQGWCIRRRVSPDFVRVFQYHGTRGETPEQLAKIMERGDVLLSENIFGKGVSATDFVGKEMNIWSDTTNLVPLGAALEVVRYGDYHDGEYCTTMLYNIEIIARTEPYYITEDVELCVRVRADRDKNFIENLKADSESQLRVGNIYIAEVYDFDDIRRVFQQEQSNSINLYVVGLSFLMLNIFLGLLGTFWFRTQQRRSDIALHKIFGATDRAVFRRLISEGMLLLVIVTPLAIAINFAISCFVLDINFNDDSSSKIVHLLLCSAIAFLLIALMIIIGISIPARKAMRLAPAEVLRNE